MGINTAWVPNVSIQMTCLALAILSSLALADRLAGARHLTLICTTQASQHIPHFYLKLSKSQPPAAQRWGKTKLRRPSSPCRFSLAAEMRWAPLASKSDFCCAHPATITSATSLNWDKPCTNAEHILKHMRIMKPFPIRCVTPTRLNLLSCGHFWWWHSKHSNQMACPPGLRRHFTPSYSCEHTQPETKGKPPQHPQRLMTSAWQNITPKTYPLVFTTTNL